MQMRYRARSDYARCAKRALREWPGEGLTYAYISWGVSMGEELPSGQRPAVVPANAGTHNHSPELVALRLDDFLPDNKYHAVWVPAFRRDDR